MTEPKETHGVRRKKLGGGPHGLGDPEDKSLRQVEKDILVMQILRDRTRKEKCAEESKAFADCCRESGISMVYTCRKETATLKACSEKWYTDKDFIADCTRQYIEERSLYRRTGITKKQREYERVMGNAT